MVAKPSRSEGRGDETKRIRRRDLLRGVVVLLPVMALPAIALADDSPVRSFVGTYKYAGDKAERKARNAAIDDVVRRMTPIARGIARGKLQDATAIPSHVTFAVDAKNLTVTEMEALTAPLDGSAVKVKGYDDAEMKLTYEIGEGQIVQKLSGDGKGRKTHYALPDPASLKVHVHVYAKQLPIPLDYDLTFARPKAKGSGHG